jgi:6-phosphogluconate dehydrogenase
MDAARQVALNWAFLMDVMDMDFDELYPMFKAWCESLPDDKMAEIMATAEALSDEDDDGDTLHTADQIWGDLDNAPTGTWIEEPPAKGIDPWPTKKRPKDGWLPSVN